MRNSNLLRLPGRGCVLQVAWEAKIGAPTFLPSAWPTGTTDSGPWVWACSCNAVTMAESRRRSPEAAPVSSEGIQGHQTRCDAKWAWIRIMRKSGSPRAHTHTDGTLRSPPFCPSSLSLGDRHVHWRSRIARCPNLVRKAFRSTAQSLHRLNARWIYRVGNASTTIDTGWHACAPGTPYVCPDWSRNNGPCWKAITLTQSRLSRHQNFRCGYFSNRNWWLRYASTRDQ